MAFFDKLNDFAKNLGEMTNDAIETGKLNSKINQERNLAEEELKKIGGYYYNQFLAGGEIPQEILEAYTSACAHYDAAEVAQAEIDRIKAENEAQKAAQVQAAAQAQAASMQVQEPVAAQPTMASAAKYCPSCGAAVQSGMKFCSQCGQRMEQSGDMSR